MTTVQNAPALAIDKALGNDTLRQIQVLERRIVWNLIRHLETAGFRVWETFDGDNLEHPTDAKAAMELVFNLDEVSLRFVHKDTPTPATLPTTYDESEDVDWHGVLLVLGNGEDIISDWNYYADDRDGFNAAMESFKVAACF